MKGKNCACSISYTHNKGEEYPFKRTNLTLACVLKESETSSRKVLHPKCYTAAVAHQFTFPISNPFSSGYSEHICPFAEAGSIKFFLEIEPLSP